MKRFLTILICIIVLCSLPVVAFAEDVEPPVDAPTVTDTDSLETDVVPDAPEVEDDPNDLSVEKIADYVENHFEEISVIVTLILSIFYRARNGKSLNKSITTLNNNSVAVVQNSETTIKNALSIMEKFEERVKEYEKSTEKIISKMTKHLEASKRANVELANEVAELLILANIPNSKKDELYARHLAAVNAIAEVEYIDKDTEVKENEDKEE